MSGFGTKKPGADVGLQLTFPAEFSRAYRMERMKLRYAPSAESLAPAVQDYVGSDLQAQYHREKREEAHRMVKAGVEATQQARARAFSSHAGYFGMPKAVLSQRKIGSDYGVGSGGGIGFQHGASSSEGLTGGVLGSPEGMAWAKEAMQRRKAQYDAIAASALEGPTMQAQVEAPALDFSETARVELVTFLSQLASQVAAGKLELSSETFRRFISLLIRFVTVCEKEELDDVYDQVLEIFKYLEAVEGGRYGRETPFVAPMAQMFEKVLAYLDMMYKRFGGGTRPTMSAKESRDLSRAALRSSGLTAFNSLLAKTFQGLEQPIEDTAGPASLTTSTMIGPGASRGTGVAEGRRAAASQFTRPSVSAEISGGPTRVASTADWSETPRDQFGRQGTTGEARGARRYAGEGEGDIAVSEQDLAAQATEEAIGSTGGVPSVSVYERLQRSPEERAAAEARSAETMGEAVPAATATAFATEIPTPEEYWASWTQRGFKIPQTAIAEYFRTTVPTAEAIEPFIQTFVGQGQEAVSNMRFLINSLRGRRGARKVEANQPYRLRSLLRDELGLIFQ